MNDGWSHADTITSSHQFDGHGLPDFSPSTFPSPLPALPVATSLSALPNSNRFSAPLPMDSQGSFSSLHPQLNSLDNPAHFNNGSSTVSPYPSFNSFPPQPHHSIYSPSPTFSNQIPLNSGHLSSTASLRDDPLDLSFLPLGGGHISAVSDPLHSSQSSLSESVHTIDYCPNPVVTGSRTMPLQPSAISVVPESNPSLPHDLDLFTDLGIRVEDYLGDTVHNSNTASLHGLQSKLAGKVANTAVTSELEPRVRKESRKRSKPQHLKQGNSPKLIASSTGCISPLSTGLNKLPSSLIESTRHHSLPPPNQLLETSVSSPPLSVPPATIKKPEPSMTENTTTATSGNASDTSSGVSSAGTKLSCSSSHSSPSPSPSAASGSNSPAREEEDDGCIIPVPEPNPGLGDKKEYMRESPFLPPSPPLANESINLHPEVPVYEVG